jgi:gliding motility-associated-like protein
MKKVIGYLVIIGLGLVSLDMKSQSVESYHVHDILSSKEVKIQLKESFYKQLMVHPLLTDDNRGGVRQYYINNIEQYRKMLATYLTGKDVIGVDEMNRAFSTIIDNIIADYNKEKRFIKFKADFYNPEDNSNNAKKGDPNDKGPGDPCVNMGFENCDFTSWDLVQGQVDNNAYGFINPTPTTNWGNGSVIGFPTTSGSGADQHYIVNGGTDPNAPIQMVNPLNGGTCSAMIGDGNGTGYLASRISQTFLVDPSNADFSYSYAAVLQDPSGHTLGEKPYFQARVFDQAGNAITCGNFQSTAGDGSPGWINNGSLQYRDWSTVIVPLQAYIGQNVTVEFTVGDCGQGGHFGYAYVEASCAPLQIVPSDTVICGNPVTLNAPSPFNGTYLWNTGATTSSITTSTPGLYTVDLITAPGCFITLDVTIIADSTMPTANFIADTVCQGSPTTFTDLSTTPIGTISSWAWDFDNDGIVDNTTQNPTYTFPAIGTYPVNLSLGSGTCGHDTTINVVVNAVPIAAFTVTSGCFGTAANFTDLSNPNGGVITTWQWDFDNNGVIDDFTQNPTNGYPAAGTYTAELFVSAGGSCSDSVTIQVVVNPIPASNFSTGDVCLNAVTSFSDLSTIITGGITNWSWDFGDASGTSILQNPTYTYANPGNYNVTLTVTSDSGCINTFNSSLDVFPEPIAAFTTNDVCKNVAASFMDNSNPNGGTINSWEWDFDNNGTVDNTNQNPSNVYPSDGSYNVQLVVTTTSGCADTIVQPINIFPMPTADFTFVNACLGTAISFTDNSSITSGTISGWNWSFGNANTSALQNPSENYLNEGVYNVQLYVSSTNGCNDTVIKPIEVWPTPVVNFTPTEVCLNALTQFNDLSTVSSTSTPNSVTQWNWNFNGLGTSTTQNPTFTFNNEGVFPTTLVVTTNNGCVDSVTLNVTVNPLPQIDFGVDTAACAPVCVTLVNNSSISSGSNSYLWNFGDGNSSSSPTPSHCFENESYSSVMVYDVTLTATSNKGCVSTLTKPQMITVYPIPLAHFEISPEITDIIEPEITFTDLSIVASTWNWDLGDGSFSTDPNPIHEYADSGNYIVTLYIENIYGCRDTTDKLVRINPAYGIWIPNVFTPDADGLNEFFSIEGFGIKEVDLRIFDRWGLQIFHKVGESGSVSWDGVYKGDVVQEDVYVYKARVKDVFNKYHDFVGRVTVLK